MTLLLLLLAISDGIPVILFPIAMVCDTVLLTTYMLVH